MKTPRTDVPATKPPALRLGDAVAVVAPAGPVSSRAPFHRGVETLERLGFRVRFDERIFQSLRYLAGSDGERAGGLVRALEDPSVQAVVALRGGYGSARIVPLLDERLRDIRPKVFMGFSDITTLHLLLLRRGWVAFHGPMVASPALGNLPEAQARHLLSLWTDPGYLPTLRFAETEAWAAGRGAVEGVLTGGCLSLVAASLGTAYEVETEGRVLFLEDVGEPPYRIDRMLTHLRLAGKLDGVAGILLGRFHDCEQEGGGYSVTDVVRDALAGLGVPILANFPAGHAGDNWTLPLGVRVRLDATAQMIQLLEPAVADAP
ncbi:MAG: LD-carboxypeptidase [Acidobacteriota bacterium]|jgi:muramoyltetrapeptide carboxypeptidase|nr:LD-carboxypeptidase [Acidobacteriota bacterium]